MISKIIIDSFKSIERVKVELDRINVFIGANGSGKSNLLEGLGVLSAAADGKVNDQVLLNRGVRPGVPKLYKSAFPRGVSEDTSHLSPHIFFSAHSQAADYEVSLHNPLEDPRPAWRYKTEFWQCGSEKIVGRSPSMKEPPNPEQGLAALKAVDRSPKDPALELLNQLQNYAIYSPTTPVLRGIAIETQPRQPVGLSGGQLPDAVLELLKSRSENEHVRRVCTDTLDLIDWAKSFGSAPSAQLPLSPAAAASPRVIRFVDRYMRVGRNILSGYDASEGALYILFLAVLAAHNRMPNFFAIDNVDHGLNPRLARNLMKRFCSWLLESPSEKQVLMTTHNPLALDGLPLQDDRVRLFVTERTSSGRTSVRRIRLDKKIFDRAKEGWTLSRLWVMGHLGGMPNV